MTASHHEPWQIEAGHRFRDLRHRSGHTQESLSVAAGVARPVIVDLERGYRVPGPLIVRRLARPLEGVLEGRTLSSWLLGGGR